MTHFYTAPVVTLVARPVFVEPEHLPIEWRGEQTEAEALVEYAGRICYMSQRNPANRTTAQYVENILTHGHGSVLEHATFTLLVEGVSRSLTHELVRHRSGMAYSQLSQRFVDAAQTNFVIPPALLHDPMLVSAFKRACGTALEEYRGLTAVLDAEMGETTDRTLRRKRAREAARAVLPNGTETKIVVTGNARAWRHILEMRGSIHADQEIQRWAKAAFAVLLTEAPAIFGDFQENEDGLVSGHRKV